MAQYVTNFKIGNDIVYVKDAELAPIVADNQEQISNKLLYDTPENHGAVGNGVIDDTAALQETLDGGNKSILMAANKRYYVSTILRIDANTVIDLNGAELITTAGRILCNWLPDELLTGYDGKGNIVIKNGTITGGCISFIHANNVSLENIRFENCTNDHFLEICACNNYTITNCTFKGMRDSGGVLEYVNLDHCEPGNFPGFSELGSYDGTVNNNISVYGCTFELGSGAYAFGEDAFGVHSPKSSPTGNHTNIRFINNIVKGFTAYGIRINCMDNVIVANNMIDVPTYSIELGGWDVATDVQISGNEFLNLGVDSATFYLLFRAAGVNRLRIVGNTYGSNRLTRFYRYYDADSVFSTVAFDPVTYTASDTIKFPVTQFNTIRVQSGYTSSGTLHTDIVRSYGNQNFVIGDTYHVIRMNNDATAVILGTMTITDDYTLTFSGIGVRNFSLSKE